MSNEPCNCGCSTTTLASPKVVETAEPCACGCECCEQEEQAEKIAAG